jgi:hypothetical protein
MIFKRLIPLVLCGSPLAFGCQPVRLGVQIDNIQSFRKDAALVIHIRTKDGTGQVCNATRAYQVTLTVRVPSGVLFSSGNITIPAGRSDPSAPYDTVRVSLKQGNRLVTGNIWISATAQGLLSGAASLTVAVNTSPAPRRSWVMLASYDPDTIYRVQDAPTHRMGVSLVCEDAGQLPANGKAAAVLMVILKSPAPRDVTLYFPNTFPNGRSTDWDGMVRIAAGKTEMNAPVNITSHNTGDLTIDRLQKAGDESAFLLEAGSSCEISFVPPQYAFLSLDARRIILGGSATVAVTLLDAAKQPFAASDQVFGSAVPLRLTRGQGTFSPVSGKPGTYSFTPVVFGSAAIIFQDVESGLIQTLSADPSNPQSAVLEVGFPISWLFWSIVISLGAALLHYQLLGRKKKVGIRCGVGVAAGVLLMLALTQPVLPVSHWNISANTISVWIVAFVGGWCGSTAINLLSRAIVPGGPSDASDLPPTASNTA